MTDSVVYSYFNQCDRWRLRYPTGEAHWNEMMANKQSVSLEQFKALVDLSGLLDPEDQNDTLELFISDDVSSGFYQSKVGQSEVLFIQTSGYEFIFTVDGEAPHV